jgi:hypothetical protein
MGILLFLVVFFPISPSLLYFIGSFIRFEFDNERVTKKVAMNALEGQYGGDEKVNTI